MELALQRVLLLAITAASVAAARRFDHHLAGALLSLPWICGSLSLLFALRVGPGAWGQTLTVS